MASGGKKRGGAPTVEQIQADVITQLANQYWAPFSSVPKKPYDQNIIDHIYMKELAGTNFSSKRIMLLEFSQYLENYLWKYFDPDNYKNPHIMSIITMVNEKFRERVPAWEAFKTAPKQFGSFFRGVMNMSLLEEGVTLREQNSILMFLIHCFNSLEVDIIRQQIQRLVSLPIWINLLPGRRDQIFKSNTSYRKFWKSFEKNYAKAEKDTKSQLESERTFLSKHIQKFYRVLGSIPKDGKKKIQDKVAYCERFIELMVDLEAQLPTRRFFNTVMDDAHLVVQGRLANLTNREEGKLYTQLLDNLSFYVGFEINEQTGEALTDHEMTDLHYDRITSLQKAAFRHFSELRKFSLSNVASIDTRQSLTAHFSPLSNRKLHEIAAYLHILPPPPEQQDEQAADKPENVYSTEFLLELLVARHERRPSQLQTLNTMPLYPTEEIIWDENIVPCEFYSGDGCLALPKLHLQFLTLHDYLLRNFNLFRLESTYEIRQDVEDAVFRMKPWEAEDGSCYFGGWARMAMPIQGFSVVEVAKPNIGETHPARVRADVQLNLNLRPGIKAEWENLRKHDVAFLVTVKPPSRIGTPFSLKQEFISQVGLMCVRGCEVEGMLDEAGRVIEEGPEPKPEMKGDTRTFRVWLDPNQYQQDMAATIAGSRDIYETFNILMRRKPKENNFKAVLETIRDLMNTECVVPAWLHDIILGYGDPGAAHYHVMPNQIAEMNWNDTFLNIDHLRSSFPDYRIQIKIDKVAQNPEPPFRLIFSDAHKPGKRKLDEGADTAEKVIEVLPHIIPNRGPYPYSAPKRNAVPFTPTQIEAIRAGMQPGLTMVVGPPGTGKTDVAVQIIANLYHNFPEQRTLIVTHSNQALNQLFEKIMALDIDERHLLRMGHGEEALETDKDFSRYGRVNYVLAKRLELLEEIARMQESLGVSGDVAYTCETAGHFFLYQVLSRWEEYMSHVKVQSGKTGDVDKLKELFPFSKFFENAPQPIFKGKSYAEDLDIAEGCFRHIKKIFTQLEEFRAFELLRSGADRSRFLLVKEAKIIAMTCTHAALKRRDMVDIGFQYDNIMMEESAQILEIETFIPLLLQNPDDGFNRLKRWIMIGDHHQLPPVIKNMAFQKFSNMEQSLFTRFVRLGVPTVDLDAQGRARPSICRLYNWRYKKLGDLPHVSMWREYRTANPGFHYDFQLINVGDFNGVGESEPNPYFYQNLAEAEYVVAVFMYMRLLGYPANKITILTTYNGQKHLIRDVVNQRCADNPLIGHPHKVTTVDRYQGQQNDYILLSLVRTRAVGHLRDVRRLIVAMSRARLGLYVFGRVALFQNCFELTPAFNQLTRRPLQLHLAPHETYPSNRKNTDACEGHPLIINSMQHIAQFVFDFYKERVQRLMVQHGVKKQPLRPADDHYTRPRHLWPQNMRAQPGGTGMEEHPGGDSDSDDEQKGGDIEGQAEFKIKGASVKKKEDAMSKEDKIPKKDIASKGDSEAKGDNAANGVPAAKGGDAAKGDGAAKGDNALKGDQASKEELKPPGVL